MNFDITDAAPEHKAGFSTGARDDYDELRHTFEEFKAANDERLAVIEHKRGDVLLEEKVDRINQALDAQHRRLDDLALRQARPSIDGIRRQPRDGVAREHKSAFDAYVRAGDVDGLRQIETKAMSVGSNADGGYLVPVELEHAINQRVMAISPIRSIASVREISGNVYKKPFMTAGPATGWVGETTRGRRRRRRHSTRCHFRRWSFTPCRQRPRRCSTTARWISTSGSPPKSNWSSPCRKARPSWQATASTSRRDFSATPRGQCILELGQSRLHRLRRGRRVSRRPTRRMCWSI
jgi:hypothetical protein